DGVVHEIHQLATAWEGPTSDYQHRLERFSLGGEQVYVHTTAYRAGEEKQYGPANDPGVVYDESGDKLERGDTGWTSASCHWSKKRISVAKAGDVAWLHAILMAETEAKAFKMDLDYGDTPHKKLVGDPGPTCDAPVPVAAARGALLDKLVAARTALR